MRRESHVRICERLGVKFPGPTRHQDVTSTIGMLWFRGLAVLREIEQVTEGCAGNRVTGRVLLCVKCHQLFFGLHRVRRTDREQACSLCSQLVCVHQASLWTSFIHNVERGFRRAPEPAEPGRRDYLPNPCLPSLSSKAQSNFLRP